MEKPAQSYATGILFVLAATLCWSLSGIFVRLMPEMTGWQINCWRGISMSLALTLWLVLHHRRELPARLREIPPGGLIAGAAFFALGSTAYITALTFTNTANVSAIGAAAPVFTGVLAGWLMRERSGWAAWAAALVALAGVTFIVRDGLSAGDLLGNLIAVGYAFSFAGQTVVLRRYRSFDMMPAIALGGLASFLIAGAFGGFQVPAQAMPMLLLMGLLQLAIPIVLFARGARTVPAITLSLLAILDVVLNPLWTWAFTQEIPGSAAVIGSFIICGAVMLSVLATRSRAEAA